MRSVRPSATTLALLTFVVAGLLACRGEKPSSEGPASAAASASSTTSAVASVIPSASSTGASASASAVAPRDPLARADAAVRMLGTTLKGKLVAAMKAGGPAKAIDVCAVEAPALYAAIRKETGVTVGRSSLRLRSPADAPPKWVAEWLAAQGERKAEGVEPMRAVVDASVGGGSDAKSRKVARVIAPVAIEAPCLACHGEADAIAPEVKAALAARYPKDAATGYRLGDLRGAIWAELPSEP